MKLEKGSLNVLLGPTLSGKTSLMRLMAGLDRPTSGDIFMDGGSVLKTPVQKRNVAMVYQQFINYPGFSVYENIASPMRVAGVDQKTIDSKVRKAADLMKLTPYLERGVLNLSGGQQQRTALARALVKDAELVLLDEPLANLDYKLREELRIELPHLHRQLGHTMIYVTHDQTEALTFADKVVVMYEGEVVQIGTPEELFDEPKHTFVGYFIGSPGMNFLPVDVRGNQAQLGSHAIQLKGDYSEISGKIELGIRPEFTSMSSASNNKGIPAQVIGVEDIGRFKIVHATVEGHELNVVLNEGESIPSDPYMVFETSRINIYQNDHLVSPLNNGKGV
ncbi:UNVERIFIED_CONTAM: hypothetical protein GTU68_035204 [Idotea baltica]|nr:hypothetical protein [Idotea baltica]